MAKAVKKTKKEKSEARIKALTNEIYNTIERTGKKAIGDFTTTEVINALTRISHSYNTMMLDHEWKESENLPEAEDGVRNISDASNG